MRYLVLVLFLVACGPTQDEFDHECMRYCFHEGVCGDVIPFGCDSFCLNEWRSMEGQSGDCLWYTTYWYDCRSTVGCEGRASACQSRVLDVAAECEF